MPEFTQENLQEIRADIKAALATVGAKHGLEFNFRNINYSPTDFSTKLTAHWTSGPTPEEARYDLQYHRYNLPKRGSLIKIRSEYWEIVGWLKSSRKYCILCTNGNDKMRFTLSAVVAAQVLRNGPK